MNDDQKTGKSQSGLPKEGVDSLYERITSAKSRKAADALFTATNEDLAKTYQPEYPESVQNQ